MPDPPGVVVVGIGVGPLEGIAAEIKNLRYPQRHEGLRPNAKSACALLVKHKLPLIVAQTNQLTVIAEIEKFLARALFLLSSEQRQ